MRYADLVWEFGRRAKLVPSPDLPRLAIDATLKAAAKKLFKHSMAGFTALRRALVLARRLREERGAIAVRDAIIAYEDDVAEDPLSGTWGVAFNEFVEKKPKHLPTPQDVVAKLVADLEARLGRLAHPKDAGALPDGFAVEAAALRLARHYRRTGDESNMRRVVRLYGEAFVTAAERVAPMLALAWLERVAGTYRAFGLRGEADAIEVRLRELGPAAMKEMKPVSTSVEIPADVIKRLLDGTTAGSLEEVLVRIAMQFIPDKASLTEEVVRIAKEAPLSGLFTQTTMDREGRPLAKIGSVEEDLDGHVVRQTSQRMLVETPWLRATINRMRERLSPAAGDLRTYLLTSPVFETGKAAIVERGLAAYLDGDGITAAPILVPQLEAAVRNLMRLSGGSTYKAHRLGGLVLKNLDDLLREEPVAQILGENVVHYFRVLFTDQRGWNLRNDVCHGITAEEAFSWQMTDRIFHALLVLALLREQRQEGEASHGDSGVNDTRAAASSGANSTSPTEETVVSGKKRANDAAIEKFMGYFTDQLRRIGGLESDHYRKTLFVTLIDTLSRAAVPHLKDKNRERFLGFVDGWGDWPDRERVSLPQLMGNLASERELADGRLGAEVRRRLGVWRDGRTYYAADDPAKEELLEFVADDRERRLIDQHTHLSLLWVYRNMLVHEFREPGYDMGVLDDDAVPYYMMQREEGLSRWELAYPTSFFAALAERTLLNLKKHLQANDLDPYAFYEFGSTWKQIVLRRR